jgi:hypothetical protein
VTSSPPKTGHIANHDSQPVTGRRDSVSSVQDGGTASFCTVCTICTICTRARLLGGKDRKTESCAGPQHAPFNLRHAPSNLQPAPWRHRKGSSAVAAFACSNSASTRAIVGARGVASEHHGQLQTLCKAWSSRPSPTYYWHLITGTISAGVPLQTRPMWRQMQH